MPVTRKRDEDAPERHQSSPEELWNVARTWVVSWLRAASLAFPTEVSGGVSTRCLPVTVAGPHRHYTGFRVPRSLELSSRIYRGLRSAASASAKSRLSKARVASYVARRASSGDAARSNSSSSIAIARTSARDGGSTTLMRARRGTRR